MSGIVDCFEALSILNLISTLILMVPFVVVLLVGAGLVMLLWVGRYRRLEQKLRRNLGVIGNKQGPRHYFCSSIDLRYGDCAF